MENIENITEIYVNADMTPITTRYNGSWHVIKHTTKNDADYSILIWENIYQAQEDTEEFWSEEYPGEPMDTQSIFEYACVRTMEMFEDYGVKIIIDKK